MYILLLYLFNATIEYKDILSPSVWVNNTNNIQKALLFYIVYWYLNQKSDEFKQIKFL